MYYEIHKHFNYNINYVNILDKKQIKLHLKECRVLENISQLLKLILKNCT